jgi:hypothetical protein
MSGGPVEPANNNQPPPDDSERRLWFLLLAIGLMTLLGFTMALLLT